MLNSNEIISEYNNLSDMIKKLAEIGIEEFVEIEKGFSSFGKKLNEFLISSIDAVAKAKNDQEKCEKLLKEIENAISKDDFEYHTKLVMQEYDVYWDIIEENTKKFLITASFMLNLLKSKESDFSPIVLEFGKAVEVEMTEKIYADFIKIQSKAPIKPFKGSLMDAIKKYKREQEVYLPFRMMFASLVKPNINDGSYYWLLHQSLNNDGWEMSTLTDLKFIKTGENYAMQYRNPAAHTHIFTKLEADSCKIKTDSIIHTVLSAYPKL